MSISYELLLREKVCKILFLEVQKLINHLIVGFVFSCSFVGVAEIVYWSHKKEYLKAKAKYLRDVIDQKNDLTNKNEPFYTCVYDKWNSGEMALSDANTVCGMKFEHN